MSITAIVRPEILGLVAYQSAEQKNNTIRLNANEASWDRIADNAELALNRYPEARPDDLRSRLAEWYGVRDENVLVTRGSSEAIDLLIRSFCRASLDNIVLSPPTFDMYRVYGEIHGAEVVNVPLTARNDFAIDCDALLEACTPDSKLIFICSPNNPTGQLVPQSKLLALLEARRGQSIVVVDEAYIEFSGTASMSALVNEYDNLAVLRTTSKALALAGTRCGCAIANREVIDVLDRVLPPYSMPTSVAREVVDALTSDSLALALLGINKTMVAREDLTGRLRELPIVERVWDSAANFVLVRFHDAALVNREAISAGILLREFGSQSGLDNCLRITVGNQQEIEILMELLSDIGARTSA